MSLPRLALALACASTFLAAAPAAAQTAERPEVRRGDEWQFVVWYDTPSVEPNRVWVVDEVTEAEIRGKENGEPLLLTRDLNPVDSPLNRQVGTRLLRFPLSIGSTWQYASDVAFKDNQSRAKVQATVRVVGREKVTVPAGEFDAFKLEAKGTISGSSKGGPGRLDGATQSTYWYAPKARAIVKLVTKNTYRGESTVELVSMKAGK